MAAIRIKLVKSISVSVENSQLFKNRLENKIGNNLSSIISNRKRNILINYRVKSLYNSSSKKSYNHNNFNYLLDAPSLQISNEYSDQSVNVSQNPLKYQNIYAFKNLLFRFQPIPNFNRTADKLFITIVY